MSFFRDERHHRQRTRIALSVPLLVTSIDPNVRFESLCDAIDVSSSGVQLRLSRSLAVGTRLRLDILHTDRITLGRVVSSRSLGRYTWRMGIQLVEQTGNFWGLIAPPADWNPTRHASERYDDWAWIG